MHEIKNLRALGPEVAGTTPPPTPTLAGIADWIKDINTRMEGSNNALAERLCAIRGAWPVCADEVHSKTEEADGLLPLIAERLAALEQKIRDYEACVKQVYEIC